MANRFRALLEAFVAPANSARTPKDIAVNVMNRTGTKARTIKRYPTPRTVLN